MKYKFKPQTAILVAGIMAAAYAEACYQQVTSAYCGIAAGTPLNTTIGWWNDDGTQGSSSVVKARTDWYYQATDMWLPGTGSGYNTVNNDGNQPTYCHGPAEFADWAGQTVYATWGDGDSAYFDSNLKFGTVNASDTCQ